MGSILRSGNMEIGHGSRSSRSFSAAFRGVSSRNLAEKKIVCTSLREISRRFLRESSRLRIFVRGLNAKKELVFWADL